MCSGGATAPTCIKRQISDGKKQSSEQPRSPKKAAASGLVSYERALAVKEQQDEEEPMNEVDMMSTLIEYEHMGIGCCDNEPDNYYLCYQECDDGYRQIVVSAELYDDCRRS